MASHAKARPKATCKATTRAGNPCRKLAGEDGFCVFHSGKLDLSELGRRGGKARGRRKQEQVGERLEGLAHAALEELLRSEGNATARAAAARLVVDKLATTHSSMSVELAKRAVYQQLQAESELAAQGAIEKLRHKLDMQAATTDWRRGGWSLARLRAERERLAGELAELDAEIVNPDRKRKGPRGPRSSATPEG